MEPPRAASSQTSSTSSDGRGGRQGPWPRPSQSLSRGTDCPGNSPRWPVPAEVSSAKVWGFGEQHGGRRPSVWWSPQRHRRGTPNPSCLWARQAWLPGPSRGGSQAGGGLPERASASLSAHLPAPVESGARVPRPGVTRVAVIPVPVINRARNSHSYQAESQPRVGGPGCVLSRASSCSSDLLS